MCIDSLLPTDEDPYVTIDGGSIDMCDKCSQIETPVIHLDKTASSEAGKVCPTCYRGDDTLLSVFAFDNGLPQEVVDVWIDDHVLPESVREEVTNEWWSGPDTADPDLFSSIELKFIDISWTVVLEYGCLYSERGREGVDVVQPFAKSRIGVKENDRVLLLGGDVPIWTKMFMETLSVYATNTVFEHSHPFTDRVV